MEPPLPAAHHGTHHERVIPGALPDPVDEGLQFILGLYLGVVREMVWVSETSRFWVVVAGDHLVLVSDLDLDQINGVVLDSAPAVQRVSDETANSRRTTPAPADPSRTSAGRRRKT